MRNFFKNFIIIVLIFLLISGIFALVSPQTFKGVKEISFTELVKDINQEKIEKIKISGSELSLEYKSGEKALSRKEPDISLTEALLSYGVSKEKLQEIEIEVGKEKGSTLGWLLPLILLLLPILFFGWFFWMIFRQAKTGASQTFSFLRAPAKIFGTGRTPGEKVTFKDIAGLEEAKEEIKEVVDFLKNPKKYFKMGARIPRGVLLIGPPGVGKTLMARAVANEAGVPFFSMSGSEFIELFVGVGASRVRSLFETAKKHQPSIVFIDEIDSIGKIRGVGIGGGHEEREQTLNQILAEMDGFERETGVIVMAATNRPEYLDPALLRPGRFDRRIVLDLPDVKGREEILKIHCRGKPLALDVDLKEVAERTPGFSGADLEAAILAARRNKKQIYQEEFLESIEKVLLGPERKSHLLSKKEKEISAFHEAGHALVSASIPEAEQVRKISIVARGLAAGYTLALPKKEKRIKTKSEFLAEIAVLLGGYCAEKLKFKEISTGAANDLEKASILARNLVVKYGMSKLGPISFGKRESLPFLGWETEAERNYSEKVASEIDKETERFIKEAERRATAILKNKKKILEKVAEVLIEKETIEKEEFEKLVKGKIKRTLGKKK
jgi:cell division protease FtsH